MYDLIQKTQDIYVRIQKGLGSLIEDSGLQTLLNRLIPQYELSSNGNLSINYPKWEIPTIMCMGKKKGRGAKYVVIQREYDDNKNRPISKKNLNLQKRRRQEQVESFKKMYRTKYKFGGVITKEFRDNIKKAGISMGEVKR